MVLILCSAIIFRPWPTPIGVGQFVLTLAVIFLLQTLVRDLYLYRQLKASGSNPPKGVESRCFCLESGIGMIAVIAGLLLFTGSFGGRIELSTMQWILAVVVLLVSNFLLKDFVFSWNPWRIYRDPDHLNIIPRLMV